MNIDKSNYYQSSSIVISRLSLLVKHQSTSDIIDVLLFVSIKVIDGRYHCQACGKLGRFYQKEEPVAVINEAMKQVFKVLKIA
jgi:hypothetical protein